MRFLGLVSATFIVAVTACGGGIDQTPLDCPAGQRPLNGLCRTECATGADCASTEVCVGLDATGGACTPAQSTQCAFLQSDTKCVGIDSYYFYGFRGFSEYVPLPSDPPNATKDGLTSFDDSTFIASGTYGTEGCQGDAVYADVAPTTDPACTKLHDVVRCRRVGDSCRLVAGTTEERYAP